MTTTHPLLADLAAIADPEDRLINLYDLADAYATDGDPARARLLNLIGDTEALAAGPAGAEPAHDDDPAWEETLWQTLASTRDRAARADLLEQIWRDWALGLFGDDADILLQVAETERSASHAPPPSDCPLPLSIHDTSEPYPSADDDTAPIPTASSTAARDVLTACAKPAIMCLTAAVGLAAVVAVAYPSTPWQARVACGLLLIGGVCGWVAWSLWGGQSR